MITMTFVNKQVQLNLLHLCRVRRVSEQFDTNVTNLRVRVARYSVTY